MGEVGGVVSTVNTVVGLVEGSSSQKGQQSVQSPGQVVATVVLHCQPAVDEVEECFTQRVAAHHPGAAQSQQQQRQQLGRAGILSCQGEGYTVLMVQLVDVAVEPRNPNEKQTDRCLCLYYYSVPRNYHSTFSTVSQHSGTKSIILYVYLVYYKSLDFIKVKYWINIKQLHCDL